MAATRVDCGEALERLLAGNQRLREGKRRTGFGPGSAGPYAAVVGCCDAKVSPEHLFDAGPGELMVLRTPAHIVDPCLLGSLEHAVLHDGVSLIVVLAHTGCRLVKAAIDLHFKGLMDAQGPNVSAIMAQMRPSVLQAISNRGIDPQRVADLHLERTVRNLTRNSFGLTRAMDAGWLRVQPLVCQTETGIVQPVPALDKRAA